VRAVEALTYTSISLIVRVHLVGQFVQQGQYNALTHERDKTVH